MINTIILMAALSGVQLQTGLVAKQDAGVSNKLDGGVGNTLNPKNSRRAAFEQAVRVNMVEGAELSGIKLSVERILYATNVVSDTEDAAIVIFIADGERIGTVFVFRNGQWKTLPDDFK